MKAYVLAALVAISNVDGKKMNHKKINFLAQHDVPSSHTLLSQVSDDDIPAPSMEPSDSVPAAPDSLADAGHDENIVE